MKNVIYQAEIYPANKPQEKKFYIGMAKGRWKKRYDTHKYSLTHKPSNNIQDNKKGHTALSEKFWEWEDNKRSPVVKWSILMKSRPPEHLNDRCLLCIHERMRIIKFSKKEDLLNKRNELISPCPHRYYLTLPKIVGGFIDPDYN